MPARHIDTPEAAPTPDFADPLLGQFSEDEIAEARESLRRYFEIGWKIACRLQHEGKINEALTKAKVNPTVKPPHNGEQPKDHSPITI